MEGKLFWEGIAEFRGLIVKATAANFGANKIGDKRWNGSQGV